MKTHLSAATLTLNPAIDLSVTIPDFTPGAVNRADSSEDCPGGKGVNVASALAGCGLRVAVTGFLGRENAAPFESLFTSKEIEDRFVRIAGATRLGIKIIDPARKLTTDINFPGLAPAPADIESLHQTLAAIESPWWVVSGSVPPGMDPAIYREIVTSLKRRGARVLLDASGEALRRAIEAAPHIIKPNLDELEALLGTQFTGAAAVIAAARKLVAAGIELVVVSMGREGACFVTAADALVARPPDIEVRGTVGAGDAMVAGIVAAHLQRLPLQECARLASAFSLQHLTRTKTEAQLAAPDLEEAMKQITVEPPAAKPPAGAAISAT